MSETDNSEYSSSYRSISDATDSEKEDDYGTASGLVEPYRFEPVAPEGYEEPEEEDEDGLTPEVLELRSENLTDVRTWCNCGKCETGLLANPVEFRCCTEIDAVMARKSFEGVEASCICDHADFDALINETVLEQVCPLMKDKKGHSYKFPSRGTRNAKNECLRATAYRFLVRWLFGSLGWNNTRPLPACIYNKIRQKYQTSSTRGYISSEQRQANTR